MDLVQSDTMELCPTRSVEFLTPVLYPVNDKLRMHQRYIQVYNLWAFEVTDIYKKRKWCFVLNWKYIGDGH